MVISLKGSYYDRTNWFPEHEFKVCITMKGRSKLFQSNAFGLVCNKNLTWDGNCIFTKVYQIVNTKLVRCQRIYLISISYGIVLKIVNYYHKTYIKGIKEGNEKKIEQHWLRKFASLQINTKEIQYNKVEVEK